MKTGLNLLTHAMAATIMFVSLPAAGKSSLVETTMVVCDFCSERQKMGESIRALGKTVAVVDRPADTITMYAVTESGREGERTFDVKVVSTDGAPEYVLEAVDRAKRIRTLRLLDAPERFGSALTVLNNYQEARALQDWVSEDILKLAGGRASPGLALLKLLKDVWPTITVHYPDGSESQVRVFFGNDTEKSQLVARVERLSGTGLANGVIVPEFPQDFSGLDIDDLSQQEAARWIKIADFHGVLADETQAASGVGKFQCTESKLVDAIRCRVEAAD